MSQISISSHDSRATAPRRIAPTGLGVIPFRLLPVTQGLGLVPDDPNAKKVVQASPIVMGIGTGVVWGLIGAAAGAIRGDKAVKWGGVGAVSGLAFGTVAGYLSQPKDPAPAK